VRALLEDEYADVRLAALQAASALARRLVGAD